MSESDCFICRKHRGEFAVAGGFIFDDPLLSASHRWETPDGVPDDVAALTDRLRTALR